MNNHPVHPDMPRTGDMKHLARSHRREPAARRWGRAIGIGLAIAAVVLAYLLAQRISDEGDARAVAEYQKSQRAAIAALPRCRFPKPGETRIELIEASDDGTAYQRQCIYVATVAGMRPRVRMVTTQ